MLAGVSYYGLAVIPPALFALAPLAGAFRLPPRRVLALGGCATTAGLVISAVQGNLRFPQAEWRISFLAAAGLMAVQLSRLRTDAAQANERLAHLANTDSLTGLASRRAVMDTGQQLAAIRPQQRLPISVALVDLDRFKSINDTLGHQTGDDVLAEIGRRVRETLRAGDLAGRYGGEELLLVLPGDDACGGTVAVQRLLDTISQEPVVTREGPVRVTASAGLTIITGEETTLDGAISRADAALYRAKAQGRNRLAAEA